MHCAAVSPSSLHTPDLTSTDMTGYALDSTAGVWPQQMKFTLPGHLLTHLGFPSVRVVLSITFYSRICHDYGLMIFD